jgi:hypothetical protein
MYLLQQSHRVPISHLSHVSLLLNGHFLCCLVISKPIRRNVVEGISDKNGNNAAKDNAENVD